MRRDRQIHSIVEERFGASCTCVRANELLCGAQAVQTESKARIRPLRVTLDQLRVLGSCEAWHPGLFRQMARTSSGITLEFTTDSSEVIVEAVIDPEPKGTSAVLDVARRLRRNNSHDEICESPSTISSWDGIAIDIDDHELPVFMPRQGDEYFSFLLEDPKDARAAASLQLPMFGGVHTVRIHLPLLRGITLGNIWGNGSFIKPLSRDLPQMLMLGDSVAQGFISGDPRLNYPRLLADKLHMRLINQSIGGQVFQPGLLWGSPAHISPQLIICDLGDNYRYEPCSRRLVMRDIHRYFEELHRLWPHVPTLVITPIWNAEDVYPIHRLSCAREVPQLIENKVSGYDNVFLVNGQNLLEHNSEFMADYYGHPGVKGHREIARRLEIAYEALMLKTDVHTRTEAQARAQLLLEKAPKSAFPLAYNLSAGIGVLRYATEHLVILACGENYMIYGDDAKLCAQVLRVLRPRAGVCVFNPKLAKVCMQVLGRSEVHPYATCVYESKKKRRISASRHIRTLDRSYLSTIQKHYRYAADIPESELLSDLDSGHFIGGFEHGELIGFIGEHRYGSIGMLEVFRLHRRRGWGQALLSYKINQFLEAGKLPWTEIMKDNLASYELHKHMGFLIFPFDQQFWI